MHGNSGRKQSPEHIAARMASRAANLEMAPCGTHAGHQRHVQRGEEACEPCRLARNEYHRDWRETEKGGEWKRRTKTGAMSRKHRLKHAYGITPEEFDEIAERQGGHCALCPKAPKDILTVDHDHKTGQVRGLLCRNCNAALGKLGDNAEGLKRALDYLT